MPLKLGNPSTNRDWFKISSSAAESVSQALILGKDGFSSCISAFFRTIDNIKGEKSADGAAEEFLSESILFSTTRMMSQDCFVTRPNYEQSEDIFTRIMQKFEEKIKSGEYFIEIEHIEHPNNSPIVTEICNYFYEQTSFLGQKYSPEEFCMEFFQGVTAGFLNIRVRNPAQFQPLIDILLGKEIIGQNRIHAWDAYKSLLISRFEDAPLFGQEGNDPITISQIYQPLRGYWIEPDLNDQIAAEQLSVKNALKSKSAAPRTFYIDYIYDIINEWLVLEDKTDKVKLISGGPGSGKSTFAKYFASKKALDKTWRVLTVPLQRLRGTGDLGSRIDEYFRLQHDEPFDQDFAPLSTLGRDHYKNWLIIFDGLDELGKEGTSSESAAQDFASALSDWRGRIGGKINLNCIVLGRAPSMQQARTRLGLHGSGTVHLADMLPIDIQDIMGNQQDYIISDKKSVADLDQRRDFWVKWAVASGDKIDIPESMSSVELEDLTKEPLLAYLLILSGYATNNWHLAAQNRNKIYEEIFNRIWIREVSKSTRINLNDLGKVGFEAIMQALGLAAWRGGGRTGNEETFNKMRDVYIRQDLLEKAKSCGAATLGNIALLFYTKKDEHEGRGYEFLHKSFGEYLTAKALINAFIRWSSLINSSDSEMNEKDFLSRWIKIAGQNCVTMEILVFLRNEASLIAEEKHLMPWIIAREWIKTGERLINYVVINGHPPETTSVNWRQMESAQQNAEFNLFAVLDACGRIAFTSVNFGMPEELGGWKSGPIKIPAFTNSNHHFTATIKRLSSIKQVHNSFIGRNALNEYQPVAPMLLSRLAIKTFDLESNGWDHIDMEGCSIENFDAYHITIQNGNFKNTLIESILLYKCLFRFSDFSNSDIASARFIDLDIEKSKFNNTRLDATLLIKTSFAGCDFSESTISAADMDRYPIDSSTAQSLIKKTRNFRHHDLIKSWEKKSRRGTKSEQI